MGIEVIDNPRLDPESRARMERQNNARKSWVTYCADIALKESQHIFSHYGRRYTTDAAYSRDYKRAAILDVDIEDVDCSGQVGGDTLPNRTAALLVATLEMAREEGCLADLCSLLSEATAEGEPLDPARVKEGSDG